MAHAAVSSLDSAVTSPSLASRLACRALWTSTLVADAHSLSSVKFHAYDDDRTMCMLEDPAPGDCEWQLNPWRSWYNADLLYGRGTVYAFLVGIAVTVVFGPLARIDRLPGGSDLLASPVYRRASALWRTTSYQPRLGRFLLTPLAPSLVGLGIAIFFFAFTFGPQPLLWPSTAFGHSPPIGTRTGWMSLACLPFSLMFAAKVSVVSAVTGISHERLQVVHRYTGCFMFATALIHTLALSLVGHHDEAVNFNELYYWTGTAALIPQAWLTFMSASPLRHRYYEVFKVLHYLAAICFIFFLILHLDGILTAWDYCVVAGALYVPFVIFRVVRLYCRSTTATVEIVDDRTLIVEAPTSMTWTPGQHAFVRFNLGAHVLTSHPFTIASLSSPSADKSIARFVVRGRGGITARLASRARSGQSQVKIWLDGPYGGALGFDITHARFDHALLLAGGSGIAFILPLLEAIIASKSGPALAGSWSSIRLIWSTRGPSLVQRLLDVKQLGETRGVQIDIHITSSAADEKGDAVPTASSERPGLPSIIASAIENMSGSLFIAGCGPAGFTRDVRNANAAGQLRIATGKASLSEAVLHTEVFEL